MSTKPTLPCHHLLTVPQTASVLNCSPRSVWRFLAAGSLRRVRLGRAVRITRDNVEEFVAKGGTK